MPPRLTGPGKRERILVTADAVGGVWQYATDLAAGLVTRGVEVVLVVMGPAPAPFRPAGVEMVETGLALDWTAADRDELACVRARLSGLMAEVGATSAHLHAPALLGEDPAPVPTVVVTHSCVASWWDAVRGGELPPDLRWRRDDTRRGLAAAGAVVAPSRALACDLARLYGLGASPGIEVIHNGRTPGTVLPHRPEGHVLTAGRLWDEGKNAGVLDRLAARVPVRAAGPVDGPGGASARFGHLVLLGTLSAQALAHERARASAFVSMSRYEPFGLAVLEAAQAGLPLVLSDIPTFRELWNGAAEFVADDAALEPAIRRVLAEPGDRGLRAWARAARYTTGIMVDRTLALHREVAVRFSWDSA